MDLTKYEYNSRRNVVLGINGMVSTSQPLAAQAGLDMLKKGGNAIDAALATAISLTILEPTANGIGGDAFCIANIDGKMYALNGSGKSPKSLTIKALKERGFNDIPKYGVIPVTVPGQIDLWATLSEKFGNIPFEELFEPAINYARNGFPVSPSISQQWENAARIYTKVNVGEEFAEWFRNFTIDGRAPKAGDIYKNENHAQTLEKIAKSKGRDFYEGELAEKIANFCKKHGGYLTKDDLASHKTEWVDPISINYKGYDIWQLPPNGHGIVALSALSILKKDIFDYRDSVETTHKQIEAIKLAYADAKKYVADLDFMKYTTDELLNDEYLSSRRSLIGDEAIMPMAGEPKKGGTVYLSTADKDGNMVSFIQSNFYGFGSGCVVDGTGISLHNRGVGFEFEESHDNSLEPSKRPYHTIIPGFITKDNKPYCSFGVMGGFMQPQAHLQMVMNMIDFDLNPQESLDAPRFMWIKEKEVHVESSFSNTLAKELEKKGHNIIPTLKDTSFGRGQIIIRKENGTYVGGTEKRTDGYIAVY